MFYVHVQLLSLNVTSCSFPEKSLFISWHEHHCFMAIVCGWWKQIKISRSLLLTFSDKLCFHPCHHSSDIDHHPEYSVEKKLLRSLSSLTLSQFWGGLEIFTGKRKLEDRATGEGSFYPMVGSVTDVTCNHTEVLVQSACVRKHQLQQLLSARPLTVRLINNRSLHPKGVVMMMMVCLHHTVFVLYSKSVWLHLSEFSKPTGYFFFFLW